jgi:hypothetical protein
VLAAGCGKATIRLEPFGDLISRRPRVPPGTMSFSIGAAVRSGVGRLVSRNGAVLVAGYALLLLVYQASLNGLLAGVLGDALGGEAGPSVGLTYPAPTEAHALVVLLALVALSTLTVVAVRTFVAGRTDTIPGACYRRLPWATLNLVVGGIAFGLVVLVGSVFLLVPGIVAYVGLSFMTMYVAVEDEHFVAAMLRSWRLVRSEFVSVLGLLAVVVVGGGVVGFAVGIGAGALGDGVVVGVATSVLNAPVTLLPLAILSAAFDQLRGADGIAAPV